MSLLHPYIPFITEEIWHRLKNEEEESIVISPWPEPRPEFDDELAQKNMAFLQNLIRSVRTIRSEMNVPPANRANLWYRTENPKKQQLIENNNIYIQNLARVDTIKQIKGDVSLKSTAMAVVEGVEIDSPLEGLIDLEAEKKRLEKEIQRLSGQIAALEKKLSNEDFLKKAPAHVVAAEKEKLKSFTEKLKKLKQNLERL
jgi:valyl-tRNA synthetase